MPKIERELKKISNSDKLIKRIEEMKEVIERSNFANVARRVIINRCDVPISTVIKKLGLYDSME